MATPVRPAAAAPARRPPQPLPLPAAPHHDTMLTLSLALPLPLPPPVFVVRALSPDGGGVARVRSSPTGDDTPPCTECGKRFPSWKALFGHMRCHPERQWRGMTPPHFRQHRTVVAAADLQFTEQERETATSLLMLGGGRPAGAGKGKKSVLGASPSAKKVTCGASKSASSPPPTVPRCDDDHKCSVCARGFATGQALGGHKRCHWERTTACAEGTTTVAAIATPGAYSPSTTSSSQAAPATTLDLNLPPPLPQKSDGYGSLDATLDLKLGI